MIFTTTLVLIFILRLRFPRGTSICSIFYSKYIVVNMWHYSMKYYNIYHSSHLQQYLLQYSKWHKSKQCLFTTDIFYMLKSLPFMYPNVSNFVMKTSHMSSPPFWYADGPVLEDIGKAMAWAPLLKLLLLLQSLLMCVVWASYTKTMLL